MIISEKVQKIIENRMIHFDFMYDEIHSNLQKQLDLELINLITSCFNQSNINTFLEYEQTTEMILYALGKNPRKISPSKSIQDKLKKQIIRPLNIGKKFTQLKIKYRKLSKEMEKFQELLKNISKENFSQILSAKGVVFTCNHFKITRGEYNFLETFWKLEHPKNNFEKHRENQELYEQNNIQEYLLELNKNKILSTNDMILKIQETFPSLTEKFIISKIHELKITRTDKERNLIRKLKSSNPDINPDYRVKYCLLKEIVSLFGSVNKLIEFFNKKNYTISTIHQKFSQTTVIEH